MARKALLAEAIRELMISSWLVRRRSFKTYVTGLGSPRSGDFVDCDHNDLAPQPLGQVRWALLKINRLSGGRFTCLMIAIAAKRMFNRRAIPNTLVLGVRLDKAEGADAMAAHAWLRAGPFVVVGSEQMHGHAPVVCYYSDHSKI